MNPNAVNNCNFIGCIPNTDKLKYDYYQDAEPGRCRMNGFISVRRNFKKKDEQYYPQDLIPFTVFGASATYMHNNIARGDMVSMTGAIEKSADWKDSEGEIRRGQLFLNVAAVSKIYAEGSSSNNGNNANANTSNAASSAPKAAPSNPFLQPQFQSHTTKSMSDVI